MKKLFAIGIVLLIILSITIPVSASPLLIVDNADLLSDQEEAYLESKAAQLSAQYQMDIVILTVPSLGTKSSEAYADDYFDENGYGFGDDASGILLLLSMEYRDWAISTCGKGIYALSDYGIQHVFSNIAGFLSENHYFEAFDAYLNALEMYLSAYSSGAPIDGERPEYEGPGSYTPGTGEDIYYYEDTPVRNFGWYLQKLLLSLVIGAVIAGITLLIMRSQMNTARAQRGAAPYVDGGAARITQRTDIFLYSQIHKTRKQEQSSSGGSSVHRSSSGRSHGGGHGKF